jgi:hypothetical protein
MATGTISAKITPSNVSFTEKDPNVSSCHSAISR